MLCLQCELKRRVKDPETGAGEMAWDPRSCLKVNKPKESVALTEDPPAFSSQHSRRAAHSGLELQLQRTPGPSLFKKISYLFLFYAYGYFVYMYDYVSQVFLGPEEASRWRRIL